MRGIEIIEQVVCGKLCIGCGACSAMCPSGAISMVYSPLGMFQATTTAALCTGCMRCASVCPFGTDAPNEDVHSRERFAGLPGMAHDELLGYYSECSVVCRPEEPLRVESASGGAVSWLLERLLGERIVDRVACVGALSDDIGFAYRTCESVVEVRACAGSAYVPVCADELVARIREAGGRWAVVAVPCVAKALRSIAVVDRKVDESLTILIGLTCGQTKTARFPEWLRYSAGVPESETRSVRFRVKDDARPADDFAVQFDEDPARRVYWRHDVGPVWHSRVFTPPACGFCDDVFAETADMCAMDAWLPRYTHDWRGTSLVVARTPLIRGLLADMRAEDPESVAPIQLTEVLASQSGAIREKRTGLAFRLLTRKRGGKSAPTKRVVAGACGGVIDHVVWREEAAACEAVFDSAVVNDWAHTARLASRLVQRSRRVRILRSRSSYLASRFTGLFRRLTRSLSLKAGAK